jgi:hypothetical protein
MPQRRNASWYRIVAVELHGRVLHLYHLVQKYAHHGQYLAHQNPNLADGNTV